jgi:hypothetical protein
MATITAMTGMKNTSFATPGFQRRMSLPCDFISLSSRLMRSAFVVTNIVFVRSIDSPLQARSAGSWMKAGSARLFSQSLVIARTSRGSGQGHVGRSRRSIQTTTVPNNGDSTVRHRQPGVLTNAGGRENFEKFLLHCFCDRAIVPSCQPGCGRSWGGTIWRLIRKRLSDRVWSEWVSPQQEVSHLFPTNFQATQIRQATAGGAKSRRLSVFWPVRFEVEFEVRGSWGSGLPQGRSASIKPSICGLSASIVGSLGCSGAGRETALPALKVL